MMMRKIYATCSTLTLALLCLASVGCYSPELSGAGGFTCNKNGSCPEGFVCAGASGSKVCVKEGAPTPDIGAADTGPEVGPDIGADAGPKPVTCTIKSGSAMTVVSQGATGGLGLTFDPEGGRLYASYLTKKGTSRTLHVAGGDPAGALTQLQPTFDIQGGGAGTAIAARSNQWVAVFQRGNVGSQQFAAVRSSDKGATPIDLGKPGNQAGTNPDVLLSADGKTIAAVHQYKEKAIITSPKIAELVRVDYDSGSPVGNPVRVTLTGYNDSGFANRVIVDDGAKPPVLLYGTIAKKDNKDSAAVLTELPIGGGPPQQLPAIALGEALIDTASVGLAPGFHLALARKASGQEQVVTYRKPQSSDDKPVPGLTKTGRPRVAVLDRMVAILVIDELLNPKLVVLDERNELWSAPLSLPDKALDTQLVAVPGKPGSDEVVFHAIYRAPTGVNDSKVLHQPVVCVRN